MHDRLQGDRPGFLKYSANLSSAEILTFGSEFRVEAKVSAIWEARAMASRMARNKLGKHVLHLNASLVYTRQFLHATKVGDHPQAPQAGR